MWEKSPLTNLAKGEILRKQRFFLKKCKYTNNIC